MAKGRHAAKERLQQTEQLPVRCRRSRQAQGSARRYRQLRYPRRKQKARSRHRLATRKTARPPDHRIQDRRRSPRLGQ